MRAKTVPAIINRPGAGSPERLTIIAFLVIVVVLGLNFVAVRYSNRELPPFWGASLRFAIASAVLAGLVAHRRIPLPRGKALVGALLYGALAVGALYALLYWALVRVPANMTSVLIATVPLVTLLVASAIGQERLHWRGLLGTVGALAGIGIAFAEQVSTDVPIAALLAILAGAFFAALSGIVVKGFLRSHPLATNTIAMAMGAALPRKAAS